jgi:hypothetical protein
MGRRIFMVNLTPIGFPTFAAVYNALHYGNFSALVNRKVG